MREDLMMALSQLFMNTEIALNNYKNKVIPKEITPIQYNIMEYVYFNPNKSMSSISKCIYMSLPNTSREVKKLMEFGLLVKIPSENDQRIKIISVSSKGKEFMESRLFEISQLVDNQLRELSEDQITEIIKSMNKVNNDFFELINE